MVLRSVIKKAEINKDSTKPKKSRKESCQTRWRINMHC